MTPLEQQMIAELLVTQTFTDFLADYLTQKGVPSTSDEGLDTLVPKVLTITSGGSKAYDYERVNVAPTIDLKLATQTAIIETLTNANAFAITLPTPLLDKINESILTIKIGSTVPSITLPIIAGWHTDVVALAPMTTRTIVFEQLTFDGINYEVWASCDKQ